VLRRVMLLVGIAACKAPPAPRAPELEPAPVASTPMPEPVPSVPPIAAEPPCDPTPPVAIEEDEPDPDDPDTRTRRERARRRLAKGVEARLRAELPAYRAACEVALAGSCAAQADLDGDGERDELVLVRSDRGEGGLAILWGAGGSALLGAGVRCQTWTVTELANLDGSPIAPPSREEVPADLDWLRLWEVWRRDGAELVSPRKRRVPATGALGDAILLDGGDAAVLVHRGADGWVQVQLGY